MFTSDVPFMEWEIPVMLRFFRFVRAVSYFLDQSPNGHGGTRTLIGTNPQVSPVSLELQPLAVFYNLSLLRETNSATRPEALTGFSC